jgi:hypothetical protein
MPALIYVLCGVTSLLCAIMLYRGYRQTAVRLLLWSSLCFLALTGENVLLYYDKVIVPHLDYSVARKVPGLIGVCLLLFGLVWESK